MLLNTSKIYLYKTTLQLPALTGRTKRVLDIVVGGCSAILRVIAECTKIARVTFCASAVRSDAADGAAIDAVEGAK